MRVLLVCASLTCLTFARPPFQFYSRDRPSLQSDDSRRAKPKYSGAAVLLRPDYAVWNMVSALKNYLGLEDDSNRSDVLRNHAEFNQQLKRLIGLRTVR